MYHYQRHKFALKALLSPDHNISQVWLQSRHFLCGLFLTSIMKKCFVRPMCGFCPQTHTHSLGLHKRVESVQVGEQLNRVLSHWNEYWGCCGVSFVNPSHFLDCWSVPSLCGQACLVRFLWKLTLPRWTKSGCGLETMSNFCHGEFHIHAYISAKSD